MLCLKLVKLINDLAIRLPLVGLYIHIAANVVLCNWLQDLRATDSPYCIAEVLFFLCDPSPVVILLLLGHFCILISCFILVRFWTIFCGPIFPVFFYKVGF